MILASGKAAKALNIAPIAVIRAHASHAEKPSRFTHAPVGAIEKVMAKTDWSIDDIDLVEVNEAFAMVAMTAINAINIPEDKINIHGGAVALGDANDACDAIVDLWVPGQMVTREQQTNNQSTN